MIISRNPRGQNLFPFAAFALGLIYTAEGVASAPAGPLVMEVVSGGEQIGLLGAPLREPLVVRVVDEAGRPLEGVDVTFSAETMGGRFSYETTATDSEGLAEAYWSLGTSSELQYASASTSGAQSVSFAAEGISLNLCEHRVVSRLPNFGQPYTLCEMGRRIPGELVVEPGVTVIAEPGAHLMIDGNLIAEGTPEEPIRFIGRVERPGSWQGIVFWERGGGSLDNVEVAHGGGGMFDKYIPANLLLLGGPVTIRRSLLRDSATWGIEASQAYGVSLPGFEENRLEGNRNAGLRIRPGLIHYIDGLTTFTGNTDDRIEVMGNLSSPYEGHQVWRETTSPFLLFYGAISLTDTTVEVEPGFRMVIGDFADGISVARSASIRAFGTSEKMIRFWAESEIAGAWDGIQIWSQLDNILSYVDVAHGGRRNFANITLDQQASLSLSNSIIRESRNEGLNAVRGSSLPRFSHNLFQNNAGSGLMIRADQMRYIDNDSMFEDNAIDAIDVNASGLSGDAHVWRRTTVPFRVIGGTINVDTELMIEPGFSLLATEGTGYLRIRSNGSISALGTAGNMIRFTAEREVPGDWSGIWIESSLGNVLSFVEIGHGGRGADGRNIRLAGSAAISDSIIRDSANIGLDAQRASSLAGFSNNSFKDNAQLGLLIRAEHMSYMDGDSSFVGNGTDAIEVSGGSLKDKPYVWPRTTSPFLLKGFIDVETDLEIEPGFKLNASAGRSGIRIRPQGSIRAVGTRKDRIRFTSELKQPGDWQGLTIESDAENELTYVEVAHGGQGDGHNIVLTGSAKITNCEIRDSGSLGLEAVRARSLAGFSSNHFEGNTQAPIRISPQHMRYMDRQSTFSGNSVDGIEVVGGGLARDWHVWRRTTVPFLINGDISVDTDLEIEPGFKLNAAARTTITIRPSGSVQAIGTPDEPIRLTSQGGQPGDWKGLRVESPGINKLAHVEIAHGGYWDTSNVFVGRGASLEIYDSLIRESSRYGITLNAPAQFLEERNDFEGNWLGDISGN